MLPTLLAAAGDPDIAAELLKGKTIGDRTYKVHLDGYDLAPAFKGTAEWPRKEFIYWTDDGNVAALRYENWKVTFLEQKAEGMANSLYLCNERYTSRSWTRPVKGLI